MTGTTPLEPTCPVISCYLCMWAWIHISLYLWMHTDAHILIWGLLVIWGEVESLFQSLEHCRCQLCHILLWKLHKICLCTCHGGISVCDAVKPLCLMAGCTLNIQLFVISLSPWLCRTNPSINPATCTISLGLTELRIFDASKNHSVPYKDKWKGVQAVNLLRFTFFCLPVLYSF